MPESNRYSTPETYGLTSTTAQNLPVSVPAFPANISSWNSQLDNFPIASGNDQLMSTQDTTSVWHPQSASFRDSLLTFNLVTPIIDFLNPYLSSRKQTISGLRASTIPVLQTGKPLPVVQWQEGTELEAVALFEVEEAKYCNALIHYGEGTTFQPDGRRWRQPRIKWSVRDFQRLKTLYVILVQAVGRQQVPEDDLERRLSMETVQDNME